MIFQEDFPGLGDFGWIWHLGKVQGHNPVSQVGCLLADEPRVVFKLLQAGLVVVDTKEYIPIKVHPFCDTVNLVHFIDEPLNVEVLEPLELNDRLPLIIIRGRNWLEVHLVVKLVHSIQQNAQVPEVLVEIIVDAESLVVP